MILRTKPSVHGRGHENIAVLRFSPHTPPLFPPGPTRAPTRTSPGFRDLGVFLEFAQLARSLSRADSSHELLKLSRSPNFRWSVIQQKHFIEGKQIN